MKQLKLALSQRPKLYVIKKGNPPRRPPNRSVRAREYFLPEEIEALRLHARSTRYPLRDEALIVVSYRHGLRVGEAVDLRWDDIDLIRKTIHIHRSKREREQVHCLADDEAMLLAAMPRRGEFVFTSERGDRLSKRGGHDIVQKIGNAAGLKMAHPHMLRHSRGYVLANKGTDTRAIQEYLGHLDIRSTIIYTQLAHERVRGLEQD